MRIVLDENIPLAEHYFASFGELIFKPGREINALDVVDADILIVRSVTKVNAALLNGSRVRFVGSCTIGTDHIDLAYLRANGIAFAHAPGCNADAVVDYVLCCLYRLRDVKNPADTTVGVVGNGNVGSRLVARLRRSGFSVRVNDPPQADAGVAGLSSLAEVMACDVVSVHVPLTRTGAYPTYHLLSEKALARLPSNALLINSARGGVVDESALIKMLAMRKDLAVALDVWEGEPVVSPVLASQVQIATPHIAGYSVEGKIRGTFMIYQALAEFRGTPPALPLALPEPRRIEAQHDLRSLLASVYDPVQDSLALRQTLSLDEAARAKAFDQLRKYYPERLELGRYIVDSVTIPHPILSAHGFQLANEC
ncbi:MAG TPA: 4-phosphoerythronate dehydrogenase [Pseudomonadales bacterium]|nr:4-phosphoerythronate dehydrogenase [Pseudomonadales bacterium]